MTRQQYFSLCFQNSFAHSTTHSHSLSHNICTSLTHTICTHTQTHTHTHTHIGLNAGKGHNARCANHCCRELAFGREFPRDAEVAKFDVLLVVLSISREEDVLCLEVSVKNVQAVQILQQTNATYVKGEREKNVTQISIQTHTLSRDSPGMKIRKFQFQRNSSIFSYCPTVK